MSKRRINLPRRNFLQTASYAAVSSSLLGTLGSLQRAQAAASGNDYKALVCVYLGGGADSYNLLIPTSNTSNPATDYQTYFTTRGGLPADMGMAVPQQDILALNGSPFGAHPQMTRMQQLYNSGALAPVANVGSLIEPVTKAQIYAESVALPPQLFSHSDQTTQWHKGWADGPEPKGWFGRVADLVTSLNPSPSPSMNISIAGNNVLQVGDTVVPYSMNTGGPTGLQTSGDAEGAADMRARVEAIMAESSHLLGTEYAAIRSRGMENFDLISEALRAQAAEDQARATPIASLFPQDNYLADQLHMVARMIDIQPTLGASRQTFFVEHGGWDTHDNQNQDLPQLIQYLSDAIGAFYDATIELGLANEVTTFSMSEFSRTLNSNGNGTDHGWGGHQFVLGGAVNGGSIYGTMPDLTLEGPDDVERGRIIPTLSIEQYAAPLASWFGVSASELNTVFPNLGNFNNNLTFI